MGVNKKNKLIESLKHLSKEIKWMNEIIKIIKKSDIPETNFDMAGLSRKIIYEAMQHKPELFDKKNDCTNELREFTLDCLKNIEISDKPKSKKPFSK